MAYLDWLEKEAAGALGQGTIGQPVALRAYLRITADHGLLLSVLARSVESAQRWFDSPRWRVSVHGSLADGHLTALAEFQKGQTALITAESFRRDAPDVVMLLFGNHGTLRFSDAPRAPEVSGGPAELVRLLERGLRSGEVLEMRDGR